MGGWVYILQCKDRTYYTGSSSNLEKRLAEHISGSFVGYTFSRRPVRLVFSQYFENIYEAICTERQVKGWSRKKKQALIAGKFDLLHELAKCRNETYHFNR